MHERGHRTDDAEHSAHDVVDTRARPQRPTFETSHVCQPAHHLYDLVERGAMLVGAGQKSLVRDINQARIELCQRLGVKAKLRHRAGLEILAEYVGAGDQLQHDLAAARVLSVDRDAHLVAVEHWEETCARADQPARVVAAQRLDLDDFGTEIAQDHAA